MLQRSHQFSLAFMCALACLPLTAATNGVRADESAPPANTSTATTEESTAVEKVEVTGSHIRRLNVEGASPVTSVTRKDLEKSGHNSVSDVLRDMGSSSFGGMREESGSNAAGTAHVNLRGLGATNTLVLLNGQRLPSDAVTGAVDLNMIPMAAVERIEILKDGASATYGSDALGGVVNIITRKDYAGTEARVQNGTPDGKGGMRTDISVVNGINRENLNVVTVAQFRNNEESYARDRFWTATNQSLTGGPGSYRGSDGKWIADANCPAERLVETPQGKFCSFNPADYMTTLPKLQQFGLMSEANMQLGSRVKLTARAAGSQRQVNWSYAAAPGSFTIPASVAATLGPGGTPLPGTDPSKPLNVRYRLTELGTRDADALSHSYNLLAGSAIQLSDEWQLDVNLGHNGVYGTDKGARGYALTAKLQEAIQSGAYNPFAPEGQKGSLEHTRYVPVEKTTTLLSSVETKAAGPIAELGEAGTMSLALGGTVTHQLYRDEFDEKSVNGEVFGNAGSSGGGFRRTQALFTELSVPLHKKLELSLAGRHDRYSDFGHTTNPKAALMFKPTSSLLVRASAGTGFRAPLMQDMYAATGIGYPTFVDAVACKKEQEAGGATPSCKPAQYEVTSGGNPGLKEQKSLSYNVGAVFEPTRNFNIGADAFLADMTNVVGIDYDDAMKAESMGMNLASRGVIVKRDANGYLESIEAPMQNLAAQQVSGLDLSTSLRISRVRLSSEHSQLFHFKEEGFPGTGLVNKLGENGKPAWRNTTGVTYTLADQHDLGLSALTIAGQEKKVKESGNLPSFTSLDLNYALKTKSWGTFSLGVKNVLNTVPPLDDSNPSDQLNTDLYDQNLRTVVVGYAKTF